MQINGLWQRLPGVNASVRAGGNMERMTSPLQRAAEDHRRLVAALRDPAVFGGGAERVELIETHISDVLLTGRYAYKLKKPVNLGFADFSTLDLRRRYCEARARAQPAPRAGALSRCRRDHRHAGPARARRRGSRRSNTPSGCASFRRTRLRAARSRAERSAPPTSTRWRRSSPISTAGSRSPMRTDLMARRWKSAAGARQLRRAPATRFRRRRALGARRAPGLDRGRARSACGRVRRAPPRRIRPRVPRRPAPQQHRRRRRPARHLRLHRVQRPAALDRRDERGRLHRDGSRGPRTSRPRFAVSRPLARDHRRLRRRRPAAVLLHVPGDGAREGEAAARRDSSLAGPNATRRWPAIAAISISRARRRVRRDRRWSSRTASRVRARPRQRKRWSSAAERFASAPTSSASGSTGLRRRPAADRAIGYRSLHGRRDAGDLRPRARAGARRRERRLPRRRRRHVSSPLRA